MLLTWDAPTERYFHHGLDRGVLYLPDPVVWNGLITVDEMGGGESDIVYRDGKIIFADIDPSDFEANISAFTYPDEFSECLGIVEAAENLFVDNQKPKRFGLSYRTLVGSGTEGDMFGYQIHLVYNAIASIGRRQRKTLTDTPEPMTFDFNIVCTPVKIPGFRPSAHYILDTRGMNSGQITELEDVLYGSGVTAGTLPTVTDLFDMMNFGVIMRVHDEGGGIVSIKGSSQYFTQLPDGSWSITNLNAIDTGDEWSISDGGNTDVIP